MRSATAADLDYGLRAVAVSVTVALLVAMAHRQPPEPRPSLTQAIDAAIADGAAFLLARQSEDGAWRSDVYGAFRRGDALTPLALRALLALPPAPASSAAELDLAVARGSDYLAALAPGIGAPVDPPLFAVYTAAQATEVLAQSSEPAHRAARDAWLAALEGRQLSEALGWSADEAPFGGWGYSTAVPRKPPPGALQPPLLEANLSATVFALEGLRAAGTAADGPACRRALIFLERLQNYAEPASDFDDGGFHFIDADPVRNKAGVAGTDASGRVRFRSYGSATADGLRGLLLCGRTSTDPGVRAAFAWLEEHFSSQVHPGAFAPRLAADRDGLFYYWAASVARAFNLARLGPRLNPAGRPPVPWAEQLAQQLIDRQGSGGAWVNPVVTMREDEPIVATSMALLALSDLRRLIPLSASPLPAGHRPGSQR